MSVAAAIFQVLAAMGWGALALAALGLARKLTPPERAAWAFAAGFGVLGWLEFWLGIAGMFTRPMLTAVLALGLPGLVLLRGPWRQPRLSGGLMAALVAGIALEFGFDLVKALSPPVDADTLAYHFDLPKRFLEAGRIFFVPRAVDGAVPLLPQLTYAPVLALGGETALGLWTMATTWGAAALIWTLVRRHADAEWAMAAALIFLTTPAVLYGGGTGQVEVRLALFALLAVGALGRWWVEGDLRWALFAGLACGFYMGGKYTGLLFAAAGAIVLVRHRPWLAMPLFGLAALVSGCQWYGWNFVNSGDPVFPMLFDVLGPERVRFWTVEANAFFRQTFLGGETPLPHTLKNLLTYPLQITFAPHPAFDAGRAGLGLAPVLLAPFAAVAAWRRRARLLASPLMAALVLLAVFYGLWFFLGGSQRVRHLVPVLPIVLLVVTVGAARWAATPARRHVLAFGLAVVILLQAAGSAVAAWWFVRHWEDDRDTYYAGVVGLYPVAQWANAHLGPSQRLLNPYRDINYLLEVPSYHAHPVDQALVDTSQQHFDPARYWREARMVGATHILAAPSLADAAYRRAARVDNPGDRLWLAADALVTQGCARVEAQLVGRQSYSRVMGNNVVNVPVDVLKLTPETCALEANP